MQRRFSMLIAGLLVVSSPASVLWLTGAGQNGDESPFKLTKEEELILELTNEARKKEKLPPLKPAPLLIQAARAHSKNMAKQQEFSHILDGKSPFQRIKATGYRYYYAGENIGMGERGYPVKDIFKGWMDSKPHRENILHKKYSEIGIAGINDEKGNTWYTQVFALPKPKR